MLIAALFLVGTASAAVISEYFVNDTHATIDEAIRIDNAEDWISMYGGESETVFINVENRADVAIEGELKTSYSPDGQGLDTTYFVGDMPLPDVDEDGKPELLIPGSTTVTVKKVISAVPNIASGEYTVTTEMKPLN